MSYRQGVGGPSGSEEKVVGLTPRQVGRRINPVIVPTSALLILLSLCSALAQTNIPPTLAGPYSSNAISPIQRRQQLRGKCIEERRTICGKILRVFPNGLLVESGYTNLLREPLTKSWLVPGSVVASRAQNLVETKVPGAVCIGQVFLTDLPRGKPKQYDYVVICGYPTGEYAYTSVGSLRKTIRRFSANLDKAVRENLDALIQKTSSPSEPK